MIFIIVVLDFGLFEVTTRDKSFQDIEKSQVHDGSF